MVPNSILGRLCGVSKDLEMLAESLNGKGPRFQRLGKHKAIESSRRMERAMGIELHPPKL
jgi:hypothetical protein